MPREAAGSLACALDFMQIAGNGGVSCRFREELNLCTENRRQQIVEIVGYATC